MLRFFVLGALLLSLNLCVSSGCNSKPDPKANPDFHEETMADPGAVMKQMQSVPVGGKPRAKANK